MKRSRVEMACFPLLLCGLGNITLAQTYRPDQPYIYRPGGNDAAMDRRWNSPWLPDDPDIYRPSGRYTPPVATATRTTTPAPATTTQSTSEQNRTTQNRTFAAPEASESSRSMRSTGSLAIPTGQRSTSTILLETFAPTEVVSGQPFDYDLKVTNLTDMALDNVVVTDSIPPSLRILSSDPRPRMGANGMTEWSIGSLGPRESRTIHMSASAGEQGQLASCASVSYNSGLCTAVNVVQPALRVTAQAPQQATLCDQIPVKIVVTNTGSGSARNVHIRQPLPNGLAMSDGSTSLDLNAGTLAAGESKEFNVMLKPSRTGQFESAPSAMADNNLKADATPISVSVGQARLAVDCRGPERSFVGRPVTHQIVVTNHGDIPATNTVVEVEVPRGATVTNTTNGGQSRGNTVMWTLGTLAPEDSRTIDVTFNGDTVGALRSAVTAKADCASAGSAQAMTDLTGIPALMLNGFDDPDPVQVGGVVTYTLILTNQGSAPLNNVRLTCTLDDSGAMQTDNVSGPTAGNAAGQTITFAPIARLDPKEKATYLVKVRAVKEGQVQLHAEAASDEITKPLIKAETTNFYR